MPVWPVVLTAVTVAITLSAIGSPGYEAIKGMVITVLQLVGFVVAARAGLQRGVSSLERRPWLLLAG